MAEKMQGPSPTGDAALEAHRAERRGLYNAFGTAWSHSFEAAVAPLIVALTGYALDRALGIFPWLTISFFLAGAVGACARLFYAYKAQMEIEEANRPWAPQHPDWAEDDEDDQ